MKKWLKWSMTGFWLFLIGSLFGYVFEGVLEFLKHGVWVSRPGLVYGPISQVYGIGFVILSAVLCKIQKPIYLFLAGTIAGGTVEYIMSLMQEYIFGTISWDYSNYFCNINGRTSLFHALMWGLIAFIFMKFIYPFLMRICEKLQTKLGYILTVILFLLLSLDIFISTAAAIRQDERKHHIPPTNRLDYFIDKHYPDTRMDSIYKNKMYRQKRDN